MSSRTDLVHERHQARLEVQRGILLLLVVPIVLVLSVALAIGLGPLLGSLLWVGGISYTVLGGVVGARKIASGTVRARRVAGRLRSLDERYQLPEARLVER